MSAEEEKSLGASAWSAGKFEEAVVHFTKAIDGSTDNDFLKVLYSNRSAAHLKLKHNSEALADANKCIELDSKWTKGYARKGDALHANGKLAEAYNAYNAGLRVDSKDKALQEKAEQVMKAMRASSSETPSSGRGWGSSDGGYNASSSASSASTGPEPPAAGMLGTIQKYGRYFMLINALLYLIPMGSFSRGCYTRAVLASVAITLVGLYSRHGMPQFNMEYAARVFQDGSAMRAFLAVLLLPSRPYFIALGVLVLAEMTSITSDLFSFARENIGSLGPQLAPMLARFAPQLAGHDLNALFSPSTLSRANSQLLLVSVYCEVAQGLFLIVELLLPTRNFMFLLLWWQYLQMRYMLDRTGQLKVVFKEVDSRIMTLINHKMCPQVVGKGYAMLKEQLAKRVTPPSATEQQQNGSGMPSMSNMMSKCTIM